MRLHESWLRSGTGLTSVLAATVPVAIQMPYEQQVKLLKGFGRSLFLFLANDFTTGTSGSEVCEILKKVKVSLIPKVQLFT